MTILAWKAFLVLRKENVFIGKIYFINADGENIFKMPTELATIRVNYASTYFNDGLLLVQFYALVRSNSNNPQYGYLDKNGQIVLTLPKKCQFALDFHEGLLLVGFEDGRQYVIENPLIPFAGTDNQGEMYDMILMQEDGCINAMRVTYFMCIWRYLIIRPL